VPDVDGPGFYHKELLGIEVSEGISSTLHCLNVGLNIKVYYTNCTRFNLVQERDNGYKNPSSLLLMAKSESKSLASMTHPDSQISSDAFLMAKRSTSAN
jgi:hypothetical protein